MGGCASNKVVTNKVATVTTVARLKEETEKKSLPENKKVKKIDKIFEDIPPLKGNLTSGYERRQLPAYTMDNSKGQLNNLRNEFWSFPLNRKTF